MTNSSSLALLDTLLGQLLFTHARMSEHYLSLGRPAGPAHFGTWPIAGELDHYGPFNIHIDLGSHRNNIFAAWDTGGAGIDDDDPILLQVEYLLQFLPHEDQLALI